MSEKKVLITGASGLLGRSVYTNFKEAGWNVLGTAFSRAGDGLAKMDILDEESVKRTVLDFQPNIIVHCAAERFPDKVDNDMDAARKLNVEATRKLAEIAASIRATVLYISSDYVFDGKNPPYEDHSETNPLNFYGRTKLEGETATLTVHPGNIVLRIPVLFGPVNYLAESAVTILLDLVKSQESKTVSDYEIRYPAHVRDIANICVELSDRKLQVPEQIKGIYQWGGQEPLTKHGMVKVIGEVFNLSVDHLIPDGKPTPGAARPYDAQLSTKKLKNLNIGKHTPFREAIKEVLEPWA